MKPEFLDRILRDYANEPLPRLDDRFNSDVWQAIEKRRKHSLWAKIKCYFFTRRLYLPPAMAASALALAVAIGIAPVAFYSRPGPLAPVRKSLHLDVFSSRLAESPATLLASLNEATRR